MTKKRPNETPPDAEEIVEPLDEAAEPATEPVGDAPEEPAVEEAPDNAEEALIKALAAEKDRFVRLAAEYDNFRRRSARERDAVYLDAQSQTILSILPVYDNLERALSHECPDEAFYKGVQMTLSQFREILAGLGVTEIKAVGEVFDPERHNAVARTEDPDAGGGIITAEFQKGFMLGGRVIRFSMVAVAN